MCYNFWQRWGLLIGLIISFSISANPAFQPTPKLKSVPNNTWIQVNQGGIKAPRGIMAYSGGWYDSKNHQFCIFGGGHWNYSGNEVWCFDISSLVWKEMYKPDVIASNGGNQGAYNNFDDRRFPGALFKPAGESIKNANPMSRHTYEQMEYVEGLGPVVWGGYTWGDGSTTRWCEHCKDTWAFNFATASWQYLYNGTNPSPNRRAGVGASAYSSTDKLLYALILSETWTFDPESARWSQVNTSGNAPWSIEMTMEYDSKRNVLYTFGGSYPNNPNLHRFDIASNTWTKLSPTGTGPVIGAVPNAGLAYDSANDVLLVLLEGTLWAYDPNKNSWTQHRTKNQPKNNDYVFGRFRYDPVNKGVWFHGWQNDQHTTWFYRYQRTP